jgi:hypothetical protein
MKISLEYLNLVKFGQKISENSRRSMNVIVTKLKKLPFSVNTMIEINNLTTTSDIDGI